MVFPDEVFVVVGSVYNTLLYGQRCFLRANKWTRVKRRMTVLTRNVGMGGGCDHETVATYREELVCCGLPILLAMDSWLQIVEA